MTSKPALRSAALARRDAIPDAVRSAASAAISETLWPLIAAEKPRVLAAYLPIRSEFDARPLISLARATGVHIALPAVVERRFMEFRLHDDAAGLVANGFGVSAPPDHAPKADPDVILVPLAAFDRRGYRLGYGRGHYDGALAALRARGRRLKLIAAAFATQEIDRVPEEPHDVPLDLIVTEREVIVPARALAFAP